MEVVENPRRMAGKGAPRDTTFGVIGHTKMDPFMRSLGGLVKETTTPGAKMPMTHKLMKMDLTEHKIAGHQNKTFIPGQHQGQVPYAGQYMKLVGGRLS
jgi:hypothetical protein